MQTGKMCHRGGRRRLRLMVLTAVVALPPGAGAAWGQAAWEQGTAGAALALHRRPALAGAAGSRWLFFAASIEEPYLIPGLSRSVAECAGRGGPWQARLRWVRLAAPRYAEDAFEYDAGCALAAGCLHLHLVGRLQRGAAEGFAAQSGGRLGGALALDPHAALTLRAQALAPPGAGSIADGMRRVPWTVSAGLFGPGIAVLAVLDGTRHHGRFLRAGLLLDGPSGACFLCGFRFDTSEISAGVMRRGRPLAVLAWRMHPVLGTSVSAGIGVMLP